MAAKVLYIEVGDRITKVCRPYKKGKEFRLRDDFVFPTPETFVADGMILEPEALGQVLTQQLTAHGVDKIHNVVFSVASGKIATREVKLPPVKEKQLDAIVKTNASDYFPVDLQDYYVAYALLENAHSGPDAYCRVLVMAAPLKLLEGYFRLAAAASLNIQTIDTCGNSHYQLVSRINGADESTIFVNVDSTSSDVSFLNGKTLLLQRTFAFGGDDMIFHYLSAAGKPVSDYLSAVRELDVRTPAFAGAAIHTNDVSSDLSRLIGSIARSVDYYNSNKYGPAPTKIVLMGPCRHLIGLCELIAENTGIETIYLDELPAFTARYPEEEAPSYIGCIGSTIKPLNMMPDTLLPKSRVQKKDSETLKSGFIIGGVLVFAALALSAFSLLTYFTAANDLAGIEGEIDRLAYTETVHDTYLAYQAGKSSLDIIAAESSLPNSQLVKFCEELEKKMPSSILLLSADCTNEGITMNITVGSYEDAATVISNLRSFESLSTVDVASVTRSENEAGIASVAFSLSCTYGTNPYLNDINPYSGLLTDTEAAPEEDVSASEAYNAETQSQLDAAVGGQQ